MNFSKTIQMYIFDGNPNGRIMCELSNWNGRVYKVARTELNEYAKRTDSENTGIYFLFGKDDDNNDTIYIGEAEKIYTRLKQHINDKEYWNDCITVISKDNLLNKAHVKYLENCFYNLALQSGRATIINNTIPTRSSVSEYDEAMLLEFIENTKLLVNTLGYKVFDTVSNYSSSNTNKIDNDDTHFYINSVRNSDAKGLIVADGFAVLKDSIISSSTVKSFPQSLNKLKKTLMDKHVIDENYKFTRDYIFTSPSLAASIVLGRSSNGRIEWKRKDGKTIKDIEESL